MNGLVDFLSMTDTLLAQESVKRYLIMAVRIFISVVCVVVSFSVGAEVYRSVDEDGNVIFSDTKREGAEAVELQETTVVPALKPPRRQNQQTDLARNKPLPYESIGIASPANEETVRDVQRVNVSVVLAPALQTRFGHKIQLYVDGAPFGSPGKKTQFALPEVNRGAHELAAAVLDRSGRELKRSNASTFFVHKHSVFSPAGGG